MNTKNLEKNEKMLNDNKKNLNNMEKKPINMLGLKKSSATFQLRISQLLAYEQVNFDAAQNVHDAFIGGRALFDRDKPCSASLKDLTAYMNCWIDEFVEPANKMFRCLDIQKEKNSDYDAWHILHTVNSGVVDVGMRLLLEHSIRTS